MGGLKVSQYQSGFYARKFEFKKGNKILQDFQAKESLAHFLGLQSQGVIAKVVSETVLPKNIQLWKQVMDSLPEHVFNFARKAMTSQLPTLHNLKLWNCSSTNLCPSCGKDQTNKHVLSHCSSPEALTQYTARHNRILEIVVKWIITHIEGSKSLYCDLRVPGARQVCDLFNGPRPDLAIVFPSRIVVGELTVCHETNLRRSRVYKLNKYSNLEAARCSAFKHPSVSVHTLEVSTLGFVVAEPNFFKFGGIPTFDQPLLKELTKAAVLASRLIYCNR